MSIGSSGNFGKLNFEIAVSRYSPDGLRSAMSATHPALEAAIKEQDADQLASALAHDQRLEEYAHVVRAKGLTGAMVYHMSADEVVTALDIADASLANHLGALLAYEKSAKAASEAHRATLEAAAGSPVKEEDAEHDGPPSVAAAHR